MKIAMLLHKDVEHDSRVRREALALVARHSVSLVHVPGAGRGAAAAVPGVELVAALPGGAPRRLPLNLHRIRLVAALVRRCLELRPDAIHAHDVAMLPPAWIAARLCGAALIYDSHELATGVVTRNRSWLAFAAAIERLLIGSADAVITVSDGIAVRLRDRYRLASTPVVVRNACDLPPPRPAGEGDVPDLRTALGVGSAPLVLHQGAVGPGRGAGVLVDAIARLPDVHLVLLGAAAQEREKAELGAHAERLGIGERVHPLPPAPLQTLLSHTAQADLGVSLLEANCENHLLALPNKVFEYLAAGVPVVTSDLPELSALVTETGAGRTADGSDPAAVATAIEAALAGGEQLRARARDAGEELSWERERDRLIDVYGRIEERAAAAAAPARTRREPPEGPPTAVALVRNSASHDGRVLRVARALAREGERAVVLAVTSEREGERSAVIGGVRILRLTPRSPLRALRAVIGPGAASTGPGAGEARPGVAASASAAGASPPVAPLPPLRRLNRGLVTLNYYRRAIATLRQWRPRIVHCNDYNTMWVGVAARALWGAALIYDSHELWPDRNGRWEHRGWLLACESLFVRLADEVLTTSPGHARAISDRHRIREPAVIRNLPEPAPNGAGPAAPCEDLLVYAGAVTTGRGLERAIEAVAEVPGARLRLLGPGAEDYRLGLRALAERHGVAGRVELADPVAPADVVAAIGEGAAGLALIEPVCLSYELSLPNKVFEYLAAGLPILASDLPVLGPMVADAGLGLAVDPADTAAVAAAMRELLDPGRNAQLRRAVATARGGLSWEGERPRLEALHRAALDAASRRTGAPVEG